MPLLLPLLRMPSAHCPHLFPSSGRPVPLSLTPLPPQAGHFCASCSNGPSTAQPKPPCPSRRPRAAIGCCSPRCSPIGCRVAEARPPATPVSNPSGPEGSAGCGGGAVRPVRPSAPAPNSSPLGQQHCGPSSLLLSLPPLHCLTYPRHRWLLGSCQISRSGEIATLAPSARAVFWGKL